MSERRIKIAISSFHFTWQNIDTTQSSCLYRTQVTGAEAARRELLEVQREDLEEEEADWQT